MTDARGVRLCSYRHSREYYGAKQEAALAGGGIN